MLVEPWETSNPWERSRVSLYLRENRQVRHILLLFHCYSSLPSSPIYTSSLLLLPLYACRHCYQLRQAAAIFFGCRGNDSDGGMRCISFWKNKKNALFFIIIIILPSFLFKKSWKIHTRLFFFIILQLRACIVWPALAIFSVSRDIFFFNEKGDDRWLQSGQRLTIIPPFFMRLLVLMTYWSFPRPLIHQVSDDSLHFCFHIIMSSHYISENI